MSKEQDDLIVFVDSDSLASRLYWDIRQAIDSNGSDKELYHTAIKALKVCCIFYEEAIGTEEIEAEAELAELEAGFRREALEQEAELATK